MMKQHPVTCKTYQLRLIWKRKEISGNANNQYSTSIKGDMQVNNSAKEFKNLC